MPKPNDREKNIHYIKAVTYAIKVLGGKSMRDLYVSINNKEPSEIELRQFYNRFYASRSNPSTTTLGETLEHLPNLHDMTLKEFFCLGDRHITPPEGD